MLKAGGILVVAVEPAGRSPAALELLGAPNPVFASMEALSQPREQTPRTGKTPPASGQ
ncbi:hypothetical protein [uncultured Thermosynechococcus sp.]|uniref:hypothetical protein n=1 Tax=uncultured Thermosynechococcus sp. TaxID=436945 RepID=UPI002636D0CA|nr:hypothetical protein [uncultured Thermosynechococcus sp.]